MSASMDHICFSGRKRTLPVRIGFMCAGKHHKEIAGE